jgi:hypothetical protein
MSHNADHFHCRRGKEFSEKCENDSECFSGSCHEDLNECWCPTPEKCNGCNNSEVPCLRVEHHSSQPLEVCTLKASTRKKGKKQGKKLDLFDAGAAHSDLYTNLDNVVKSSSRNCFSAVSFHEGSKTKLPPAFVQASLLIEDAQNISQVEVEGLRSSFLGLQIFVDDHWITHVGKEDLLFERSTKKRKRSGSAENENRSLHSKKEFVKIVKDVYPRVHIDSFDQLRNASFINSMKGNTIVVPVPGRADLDVDLLAGMGVEFIGEGPEVSEISIVGTIQSMGRTNFKNLSISFYQGSLNISGPLIFQSSQVLNITRCPPFFTEYNGLCFTVSQGIEQADDAHAFCETYELASLANANDVIPFLRDNKGSLSQNSFAWIEPVASNCSSVDSAGLTYDAVQQECESYLRVLCSAPLKEPIVGVKYTSYNSDQFIGTYRQDFLKRILDKERLPFQLGGTLSFVQNDLLDNDENPVLFKAPDSFPKGVSVSFTLNAGHSSSIEVALDTFNLTGHEGYEWPIDDEMTSLPTKIQLHTNASVCIEHVDLLVHNETGHSFVVATFPAKLVAECLDYNVCSQEDERMCGRSLMYYDMVNNCARLEKGSSVIPRDLSIDLLASECGRLTTWNHPNLGAPFLIEARVEDLSNPFQVNEFLGESHQYRFDNVSKLVFELDESTVLPVDFLVEGSGLLQAVQITRYGLTVSGLDFSLLWDCINVCDPIANPSGLRFGPQEGEVIGATLNFIAAIECQKLVEVLTISGNGRQICTSPPISVGSLAEVVEELASIALSDTLYKTLNLNVTRRLNDTADVIVPTNRGLILFQDAGVPDDGGSIEGAIFRVADLAELFLDDLKVNGTTRIFSDSLGQVEISGTDISIDSSEPFLMNEGETSLASVALYSNTTMQNVNNGRIEIMYADFHNGSAFVNSPLGTIRLSRLSVYEQFSSIDSNGLVGSLELPDARRFYKTVDDEDDQDCFGEDMPHSVISGIGTQECQQVCENEFLCSGIITYFSEEGLPQCGLCLREEACSFDCSSAVGGAYFKAVSKFHFSKVFVCPYISRPFKTITDVTLEECKLYCSYYRSCEGFRVITEDAGSSSKSCALIGDLDFAEECDQDEAAEVYVPFVPGSTNGYFNVYGNLTSPSSIAEHPGIPIDQCSRVCDKTISCSSFQVVNDVCFLYSDNNYVRTNEDTGLYLSIDDPFPKKRYMGYQSCYIPGSYATFNIKTFKRCKDHCNEDYSCVGFAFRPIRSLFEHNCELYDSATMVNSVFGPDLGCQRQPLRREPRDIMPRNLNAKKSTKSANPSYEPSLEPSFSPSNLPSSKPSLSSIPSTEPSNEPSLSNAPSLVPSFHPSSSLAPSNEPSVVPSSIPTVSSIPSAGPSLSIRPSQESEAYDLFVAFSTEIYTVSTNRAFEIVRNATGLVEDECKALCFYDSKCVAIRYDISSRTCEIGTLSEGSSIDHPFLALDSLPADETSRYASSDACYVGERLYEQEDEELVTEKASGYFHMPRTSTILTDTGDVSSVQSPAECGLQCSEHNSCVGFIYYVDHGGALNVDKIGMCEKVTSFDLGTCDAIHGNMDLYLRADIGATCQAACNVHQLCSAFVFDQGVCELYSDIALLDHCSDGEVPQRVQIGLSYHSRDGMVAVPGKCFVEYEDLRSLGCRDILQMNDGPDESTSSTTMTPWECQQYCKEDKKEFYAVHDENKCSCGSKEFLKLPFAAADQVQNCTLPCPGDASQSCGGIDFANIGETGLPVLDLTLAECKRECFFSEFCEAILFDSSGSRTRCQLQSVGDFGDSEFGDIENCDTSKTLYIESLEHYYEKPSASYIGSQSIYNATTDLKQDCQKLCDAFRSCEAIKYNDTSSVFNCELLSGKVVPLSEDEVAEGVQVAKDVTLYTLGFSPDLKEIIANISTTFDLDECKALCDQHVLCGSVVFISPTCQLYAKSAFADVTPVSNSDTPSLSNNPSSTPSDTPSLISNPSSARSEMPSLSSNPSSAPSKTAPHYIDYSYFVDPAQEFAHAKNLCVAPGIVPIRSRKTTLSIHDCASRCNSVNSCSLFTYNKNENLCVLYEIDSPLTSSGCDGVTKTFTMFTRSKFVEKENACLKDETDLDSFFMFELKSPYECAALCDKWFNCRSFRSDEMSGSCQLFESEQHSIDSCSAPTLGKLYVYYSDYRFTRLDYNFCVGGSPLTSIDDLPIEACKSICDKSIDCLSFLHTQVGLCVLYASADFSGQCTADDERDLYITYKNVVDPKSRFLFNELESCFDLMDDDADAEELSEADCKGLCELSEDCFGVQVKNETTGIIKCTLLDDGTLPSATPCDESKAFLKTKVNPYKKLNETCLQSRISFGDGLILDKEDYECMALCDIHPFCRYFLYGDSTSATNPQLRECILFDAQAVEVDDCDNERNDINFIEDYKGLTAYVNGRTFIDQITWFGEPESNFANINGLSYQECASLCDTIESCKAFVHTWNYRRAPLGTGRPLVFINTRLMRLDFESSGDHRALFLMFDLKMSRLVLDGASSDDDVRKQLVSPELTGQGTFKLKFWSSSGMCLSGKTFRKLESPTNFTLDVIQDYFVDGEAPACQKFGVSDCSDPDVIELDDFSNARFGETIKLSYSDSRGCVRLHRTFNEDIDTSGTDGNLDIPPILLNHTSEEWNETTRCEMNQTSMSNSSCDNLTMDIVNCTDSTTLADEGLYKIVEECQQTTTENCVDINGTEVSNCTEYTTTFNEATSWYLQKTAKDLLEEMYSFFESPECLHTSTSPNDIQLFSSTFSGKGCVFDEEVASFPSQEFTWASDAVTLQNKRLGLCLSKGLTLISCGSVGTVQQWVYLFTSGQLYYADDLNNMKCLTRTDDTALIIESCDKDNDKQRWQYNADLETISAVGESTDVDQECLIVSELKTAVVLGNCAEESAKWSRFEECRLNTRDRTSAMNVEKIREPGQCIDIDSSSKDAVLKNCDEAVTWRYYYDGNDARLEYASNDPQEQQCLGRRGDYDLVPLPEGLPTGLVPCSQAVYSRMAIAGEENNVFQWSLFNVKTGAPEEPFYCIDVPQSIQSECPGNLTDASSWRKYGNSGDATEISVKPSATLQDISDPEVLFQFYLFTAEGKASRVVRSRMATLVRDVERLTKLIVTVVQITTEALNLVETVKTPIEDVNVKLEDGESAFNAFKIILTPLANIPKPFGPVFKGINIPVKAVAKALKVRYQCRCWELFVRDIMKHVPTSIHLE